MRMRRCGHSRKQDGSRDAADASVRLAICYAPVMQAPATFPWPADDPLQDDALTGSMRIWQRVRGHRYSLDDVLTARSALEANPEAGSYLDLGCGIGSVLMMVMGDLSSSQAVGVEAQEQSFTLAKQNVLRNQLQDRVSLVHGDFREVSLLTAPTTGFDLITGTPPYQPPGTATPSPDPQRAYARIEYRGGVEAYLEAISRWLAADGVAVVCAEGTRPERVLDNVEALGLSVMRRRDAYPRAGRVKPLFSVWTLRKSSVSEPDYDVEDFVARDKDGVRTDAYHRLRASFGIERPPAREPDR